MSSGESHQVSNSLQELTESNPLALSKLIIQPWTRLVDFSGLNETIVAIGLILLGIHLYYSNKFSYWSRRNVKHPRPLPLVGNAYSHLRHSYHYLSHEWSKKYGKVYGYYQGTKPYLVVADAEVLKTICIKDFDKFTNRHFIDLPSDFNKRFIGLKEDDQWRSIRHILSPTFSTSKLKMMYPIMDKSINKVGQMFESYTMKGQADIDIHGHAGQISVSSTIGSLYGIDLNFKDADDPNSIQNFSRMSHEAFTPSKLDLIISYLIPHSILRFISYPNWKESFLRALNFFKNKAKSIIRHRLSSGERQKDYLQILLEARADEQAKEDENQSFDDKHHAFKGALDRKPNRLASQEKLTEDEVISQTVMFMLVATETTGRSIAYTLYLLAHHKSIQQRLYEELAHIRTFDDEGKVQFKYDDVRSHQYLDCVISESLRLMPPALYLDRKAGTDYFLEGYNIVIPKGTPIFLDFYGIMTDPDYWTDPEIFDPERFSPENKAKIVPGSYCPFGIGPRHCIGYRYALTESKLAVARLVSEYEFDVAPRAKYPPEPRKPVFIGNEFVSVRALIRRRGAT